MKAISLWQPWASLWLTPRKIHETRHWRTKHRGWLLIHAAKRPPDDLAIDPLFEAVVMSEFGRDYALVLPRGAVIGMVNLINCKRTEDLPADFSYSDDFKCGNYAPLRFAWQRTQYKIFARPIPYRGAQGFFNVPDELITEAV